MLKYVTKSRYWEILDKGIMSGIAPTPKWHLKDIQDAVAFSHLYQQTDVDIAEIGAGHSRILGALAKTNRCHAIDEYKGDGGGPKTRPGLQDVQFIDCRVGASKDKINDNSYDIVFSVSVVEHVPNVALAGFFSDCWRILKPNGLMVHLIDVYAEDGTGNNAQLWQRVECYLRPFSAGQFSLCGDVEFSSINDVAFKTSFASNSDDVMRDWNRLSPALVEKRKVAQSCTLEMVGRRIP